jgi:cysteinyl-tRNA synthetase
MRFYNTLTAQLEDFQPAGDEVKLYVCGVTPYDEAHIGHAMSAVIFDVLRRYLEFRGHHVRHVRNFTDVDDKIIDRAAERGEDPLLLSRRYSDRYDEDMRLLNVLPAHHSPRVTEEIPSIVEMIQGLIEQGFAYPARGDVYYRVNRKPDYGKLSHQSVTKLLGDQAGDGDNPLDGKESPLDFALWKGAKPGEPSWESPWGLGRPGWHIECSAMSLRYLGEQLDIHGGGTDLIFPHHENEIAQSEAYTGVVPFVRIWMHNGMLSIESEKMSKSLGNVVGVQEVLERHGADAFRLFVLSGSYRKPLNYTEDGIEGNRRGAERLRTAARRPGRAESGRTLDASAHRDRFIAALDDDLNTAAAIAVLFEFATEVNRARDAGDDIASAQALLLDLAGVLGLRLEEAESELVAAGPFIDLLVEVRKELRAAKQFQTADMIRTRLAELGVALEDTPGGTTWRLG